jgi:hypothetical protein
VFAHRGQTIRTVKGESLVHVWKAEHFKGGIRYRVDREHPSVKAVLDEAGTLGPQIRAMLRVIEETILVWRRNKLIRGTK